MKCTAWFYVVSGGSTNEFSPLDDEVLLRGKSASVWWQTANSVHVAYGIEKYFVIEGRDNPNGKVTLQAVDPSSGRARIKDVFLNGKPYIDAMKESAQ